MNFKLNLIGLLTGSSLLLATPTVAAHLDLTTWDVLGDVGIINAHSAYLSNNGLLNDDFDIGLDEKYNFSGKPAVDNFFFDLETRLGLWPGTLDLDPNKFEYALEGSALKKIVKVKAKEQLSFNWNFLSNETLFPDYGFLLVDKQVIKLADVKDIWLDSTNYEGETGWQTYNYTFANAGQYHLAFGVVDLGDYAYSSGLKIKKVRLTKTPESNAVLGLFCVGTGALLWRYKNRN